MGNVNVIKVPQAATYGRVENGAVDARNAWWDHQADNDAQQQQVGQAIGAANTAAQTSGAGQAKQDQGLVNNALSGANGYQGAAADIARGLATGAQPSQAAYQLQAGLNQATNQQRSLGNSARGSAAMAVAGQNAQANIAAQQQNAWTQGGLLKSQDMAAGRGMLNSVLGQQREQDQNYLGQQNQFNQQNQSLSDQYKLGMGQAGVALGQAANGQQNVDLGWYQGGMGSVDAQDEANQQHQRWYYDAQKQAAGANAQDGK